MVEPNAPLPRYYRLKRIIRDRIEAGDWSEGSLIPSERELCEQYGISRMTVRQALTELVHDGLLYREQGRGTFVSKKRITQQLLALTGFTQDMQTRGRRPGARMLTKCMSSADEVVAERLHVKLEQPVFAMRRLRLADGEPLAIELSYISFLGCEQLLEDDLEENSLYDLLEHKYHLRPTEAEQEVEAGLVAAPDAKLLGIPPRSAVLLTRRTTYAGRGRPIEYATATYRADKYTFYTRLVRDGDQVAGL